jgi:methylmalonyl-CoA mutase
VESDAQIIGVNSQDAGQKTVISERIEALRAEEILVVVGGVIPAQDYPMLKAAGVNRVRHALLRY